jgi:hypothetical protein
MSIRSRTESLRVGGGVLAAATLAGAAGLHGLWAAGSTWPAVTADELADLVVGRRPMPGPVACAAVTGALTVAAVATATASRGRPGRLARPSRAVAAIVSGSLLARGMGGMVAEVVGIGEATPAFRRWNRRLYNPLCIALALLVAFGRRRPASAAPGSGQCRAVRP